MRRNIMRYMCLAYVITLQRISLRVKKRFPSLQHLVDAGNPQKVCIGTVSHLLWVIFRRTHVGE